MVAGAAARGRHRRGGGEAVGSGNAGTGGNGGPSGNGAAAATRHGASSVVAPPSPAMVGPRLSRHWRRWRLRRTRRSRSGMPAPAATGVRGLSSDAGNGGSGGTGADHGGIFCPPRTPLQTPATAVRRHEQRRPCRLRLRRQLRSAATGIGGTPQQLAQRRFRGRDRVRRLRREAGEGGPASSL